MILLDLATYLQTEGLGTIATTLFMGSIPEDAVGVHDALMALFQTPGLPPDEVHSAVDDAVERPTIQVVARGVPYGYQAAEAQARNAWAALRRVRNQTLTGTRYLRIQALQSPFLLKVDDWHRPYLTFNVLCAKAL